MEAVFFIGLVIVAITQMVKMAAPDVKSWATIIIAFAVGLVVALVDQYIGVTDVSIAQGVVAALQAIGVSALASKAGGGALGDRSRPTR